MQENLESYFYRYGSNRFLLTLLPSFFNWQGLLSPENTHKLMLAGTILWFLGAIFLFGKPQKTLETLE